jgi:hypothetical protein
MSIGHRSPATARGCRREDEAAPPWIREQVPISGYRARRVVLRPAGSRPDAESRHACHALACIRVACSLLIG